MESATIPGALTAGCSASDLSAPRAPCSLPPVCLKAHIGPMTVITAECVAACCSADPAGWCALCLRAESIDTPRPSVALPRGARLGQLQVGRVLGVGWYSVVYLAYDRALAVWRVVKEYLPRTMLPAGNDPSPGEREARIMAAAAHPLVMPVLQSGWGHGSGYLVMPHAPGQTLADAHAARAAQRRATTGTPESAPGMLWTIDEVFGVLEGLHELLAHLCTVHPRIVHRDLKPANLYVVDAFELLARRLRLLDFSVAWCEGAGESVLAHTPGFASPQQCAGAPPLPQDDAWGAAATAYFLLTNTRPGFALISQDEHPGLLLDITQPPGASYVVGPVVHPCELVPTLPRRVGDAVMAALAPDPDDRAPLSHLVATLQASTNWRWPVPTALVDECGQRLSALHRAAWSSMVLAAGKAWPSDREMADYVHREARALCQRLGWTLQVRRAWTERERPVADTPDTALEWKLIPSDRFAEREPGEWEVGGGVYYIVSMGRGDGPTGVQMVVQHSGVSIGLLTAAQAVSHFAAIDMPSSLPQDLLSAYLEWMVHRFPPNAFHFT
jgi:serine/threonine protein kinase